MLQLESAGLTQKEIASRLGVHARTIRKWKSGETAPAPERYSKLSRAASGARRRLAERIDVENADGEIVRTIPTRRREHKLPRNVPIPRAIRREIRDRERGGWTLSDWINYDVRGWKLADVENFVRALYASSARERPYIQLVFLAPAEDTTISGTAYLTNKRMQRSGSGIRDLGGASEETLMRWVREHLGVSGRRSMYIAVARNRMRGNK